MTNPIRPDEISVTKKKIIPKEVIESFNEIIAKNWNGVSSSFKQVDVVEIILVKINEAISIANDSKSVLFDSEYIYSNKLIDIESIYENCGWCVNYDKPGYNESYDATFKFTRKN